MSKHTDRAMELRSQFTPAGKTVYNCAQAVVSAFADDIGLDGETCRKLGTFFRGGMQIGAVCGAVTGGMMVLGLMGESDPEVLNEYFRKVRDAHGGSMDCRDLLRENEERGGVKLAYCNGMICECIGYVEEALKARK